MSDKQVGFVVAGAVPIAAMFFGSIYVYNRMFVSGGYCEQTLQGRNSTAWVKCQ